MQRSFLPIAALCANMAFVGFAQLRNDVTPGEIVIATAPHADIFLGEKRQGAALTRHRRAGKGKLRCRAPFSVRSSGR